jgi:hypothetical protein
VARAYLTFRKSARFPRAASDEKIGVVLGLDPKTVWIHWNHFQGYGLSDYRNGVRAMLRDEQLDCTINYAVYTVLLAEYDHLRPIWATHMAIIGELHSLWTGQRTVTERKRLRCRYEGYSCNLIWQTDLNLFHKTH